MTAPSSADLISTLQNSLQHLRETLAGITEEEARANPGPGQWSAIECVEHLTIAEEATLRRLKAGEPLAAPIHLPEREARMAAGVSQRANRVQAPPAALPSGRFTSLAEAVDAFTAARGRTIEFVETDIDLRAVQVTHPFFGPVSGYELAVVAASHAVRHAAQIREIRGQTK
jgi:DinB superfamily